VSCQYTADALRGIGSEVRGSEPCVRVSFGSFDVEVRPAIVDGGWSDRELRAKLFTAGVVANVEPIELPTLDEALLFLERLVLTCELPEQWVDEANGEGGAG
jgi:hypothetical protein